MPHFAKLNEDNVVVFVTVGRDEDEHREEQLSAQTGRTYKRTSFNTRGGVHYDPKTGEPSADQSKAFRGNYAGVGFIYDEGLDAFIPPKPSEDATLDEATFSWIVPDVDTDDEE
jgi:hypothetical protein